MKKFTLELFLKIVGIVATSGLYYQNDQLHLISDKSDTLYEYDINSKKLFNITLNTSQDVTATEDSILKTDYKAMTTDGTNLYVFGSGAKQTKNQLIEVHTPIQEVLSSNDLSILYDSMKSFSETDSKDFNITGVAYQKEKWYFFNGAKEHNTIFSVDGESILDNFRIVYNPVKLPKIDGLPTVFSDGIAVNNKLYFIAIPEDPTVPGTLFGRIDLKKMKLEQTKIISTTHRFDGLTLLEKNDKEGRFLLSTDSKTIDPETFIYKLIIKL